MKSYFIVSFLAFFAALTSLVTPAMALPAANTTAVAELEERNPIIGIASAVVEGAINIVDFLVNGIKDDNKKREDFTRNLVTEMCNQNPHFNYVVVHPKHETRFDGQRGVDWDHKHFELDIAIGGTIGYELYAVRSGEFKRHGDGGFINWAWIGNTDRVEDNGSRIFFVAPP